MKLLVLLILGCTSIAAVMAQSSPNQSAKLLLDREYWQSLKQDLDYHTPPVPVIAPEVENRQLRPNTKTPAESRYELPEGLRKVLQWTGAAILLILVSILLYRLIRNARTASRTGKNAGSGTLSQWENHIKEESDLLSADLNFWREAALQGADYRLALRFAYLQVLQALAGKQLVRWQIDKTNEQYIQELLPDLLKTRLAGVTAVFEKIWYGNRQIGKEDYDQLIKSFQIMLHEIARA